MPNQVLTTRSGKPDSASVGTSGSCGERLRPLTASAFTLPPRTCARSAGSESIVPSTRPAMMSFKAGAEPL